MYSTLPAAMSGRLGATLAVWGATTFLVAMCAAASWWRSRRLAPPTHWRQVGVLSELLLYPLKSGRATVLQEAECTELGLNTPHPAIRDRSFLIFNESNRGFKTARQLPHMVLISCGAEGEKTVTFEAPGMASLTVRIPDLDTNNKITCSMWFEEKVAAVDCGEEAAKWMSRYILKKESGVRLGYHVNGLWKRKVSPAWLSYQKVFRRFTDHDMGAFADLSSYMLMTESSLAAVAEKLPNHGITVRQFRPNLVVRGSKPFEEDSWAWIKIGENVVLKVTIPCTRCVMTIINPETGIMDPEREPLKTLETFRQLTGKEEREVIGDAPALGLYLGLYSSGKISVGDPVYVA